jgi:hypothetical protein
MREMRYGIRSVYFRTGVKDVLASFAPSSYSSVTHANIMKRYTDCMSLANRERADLQGSGETMERVQGWYRAR